MQDSRQSCLRLGISLAIGALGNAGMWAVVVFLPDVERDFGVGRAEASFCYTAAMLGFALGSLVLGQALDRWGMRATLVGGALLSALGFGLSTLAPGIAWLAAAQAIVGFGTSAAFGPLIADISKWFQRRRGIAVAIVASGNYLSGALWPMVLVPVMQAHDWRAACLVLGVTMLVAVVPLALLLRGEPEGQGQAAGAAGPVMSSGMPTPALVALLCLAGVACCVAMSMPQVHIVALCVDLGFGQEVGARMLSLMLMGGVASRLVFGMIADRLGGIRTLLLAATLQGLALFLFLPFDSQATLYVVSLVFGLSQGGIVPTYALVVREYLPVRQAGRFVGAVMGSTIVGMALGGWMSGAIFDMTGSYSLAVLNGIGWNVLNVGILLLVFTRGRRRSALA